VNVYKGQFILNYRSCPNSLATFSHGKIYVQFLTRNGLGYILGVFFTNSPGHTEANESWSVDAIKLGNYYQRLLVAATVKRMHRFQIKSVSCQPCKSPLCKIGPSNGRPTS
jgi:hypothetical protein